MLSRIRLNKKFVIVALLASGAAVALLFRAPEFVQAHTRITTDVTWGADIRPIFIARCMPCHHPGGLAPDYVDLTTYGTDTQPKARAWAAQIEDEIMLGRMPPWNADPRFGSFSNSRALTKDEKDLIIAWIRGGAPQGPLRNLPVPPEFAEPAWSLGQPDVVVALPHGHVLAPKTNFDSAETTVSLSIPADTYITGYEFLVREPAIVAKVSAWLHDPAGFEPQPIEVEISGEYDPYAPENQREKTRLRTPPRGPHFLGQWVKGDGPVLFPDAAGRRIYAGSSIELRVDYVRPDWLDPEKEVRDATALGLYLAKPNEEIDLLVESARIEAAPFTVAAGAQAEQRIEYTFSENAHLLGVEPHLGPTATRVRVEVTYPDGLARTLAWVPKYQQRWATSYRFDSPVAAPAGTKLSITGYFDNTTENPDNPSSPPADVKCGPGYLEERLYANLHYAPDDHLKLQPLPVTAPTTPQGGGMLGGATTTTSLFPPSPDAKDVQQATEAIAGTIETAQEPERIRIASNGYHQIQGRMDQPGDFSLFVFDDRMQAIDPRNFSGELLFDGGARRVPLVYFSPGDDALTAFVEPVFPQSFEVKLLLGDTEEKFDFNFEKASPAAPGAEPAKTAFVQPPHGGWLEAIEGTDVQVEAAMPESGDLRFYFYGPGMKPIDPRNFRGTVETLGDGQATSIKSKINLAHPTARSEFLRAKISPELPQKVKVSLAVAAGQRDFEFEFTELSEAPWDAAADATPPPPLIAGPHGSTEFFPSANGFHFIEASLPRPGEFRLYFYDSWKNPVDPSLFSAEIEVGGRKVPLARASASDDYLTAFLSPVTPLRAKATVWIAGKQEAFNFKFDSVTIDPAARADAGIAHMDHTPLHGGQFFMADNLFHHVEGTMPVPGEFRAYFYDDYKRPVDPRNFSGSARIERLNESTGAVTEEVFPLEYRAGADYLKAIVPASFPNTLYAQVKLGGVEKRFDFQFNSITVDTGVAPSMSSMPGMAAQAPGAPSAGAQHSHYRPPFAIPATAPEILAAIDAKMADLRQRVATKDWVTLYQPAFDLRDMVDALTRPNTGVDPRQIGRVRMLYGTVNRVTNKLDRAGDTADAARIQATMDELEGSVRELRSLFPSKP